MKKFVAVAGNIGVGKSTLVSMLCNRLGWQPFFEPVGENPYLADFYRDMHQWSFHSQIFFLTRRLRSHRELLDHPTSAIQDRCVYEDAEVFAQNLFLQGLMDERDYLSYRELYRVLSEFLPPPDLVVYLRASVGTLQQRISHRGRDYEPGTAESLVRGLDRQFQPVPCPHRPRRCPRLCRPSRSPGSCRPEGRRKAHRQGRGCLLR
jgi:deoxyadenosine/deoxycytidine kinase